MTKILKILTVFFVVSAAASISNDLFGQMRAGIKGGLNVSNLYVDEVSDENARFGVNLGFYGQILSSEFLQFNLSFCFQPRVEIDMGKFF